jgi:hypothetical protein
MKRSVSAAAMAIWSLWFSLLHASFSGWHGIAPGLCVGKHHDARQHLTMEVFDVAETSSVLEILCLQVTFELSDCCGFGRCPWFHMKLSVSAAARAGIGHCQN